MHALDEVIDDLRGSESAVVRLQCKRRIPVDYGDASARSFPVTIDDRRRKRKRVHVEYSTTSAALPRVLVLRKEARVVRSQPDDAHR